MNREEYERHIAENRALILRVMGMSARLGHMRQVWGDGFDGLLDYLAVATATTDVGIKVLLESIRLSTSCRTMVLTGERATSQENDPVLMALACVAGVLGPVSSIGAGRNGREENALSIVFSGSQLHSPHENEVPADVMACWFNELTGNEFDSVIGCDLCSLNTGDQGRVLAALAFARKAERLVFVHTVDHIARFAATVCYALQQMVHAENARTHALFNGALRRSDEELIFASAGAFRKMPEIIFVAVGNWTDRDPHRGSDDGKGIPRWREAFGPMQAAEETLPLPGGQKVGGEYTAGRYFAEQNPTESLGYACGALSPRDMLDLLGMR